MFKYLLPLWQNSRFGHPLGPNPAGVGHFIWCSEHFRGGHELGQCPSFGKQKSGDVCVPVSWSHVPGHVCSFSWQKAGQNSVNLKKNGEII